MTKADRAMKEEEGATVRVLIRENIRENMGNFLLNF